MMAMQKDKIAASFMCLDLGILTSTDTGHDSALFQMTFIPENSSQHTKVNHNNASGKIGFDIWCTVYLFKQTDPEKLLSFHFDWMKTTIFGQDIGIMHEEFHGILSFKAENIYIIVEETL